MVTFNSLGIGCDCGACEVAERTLDCSQCHKRKPERDFNRERRTARGRRVECRQCQSEYNQKFNADKPLYNIWNLMIQRCHNPDNQAYSFYGERGIRVCDRWRIYENFEADMSPRPSRLYSIDRIDNSLGYSPENCRWATAKDQANNTRGNRIIEIDGVPRTLQEWIQIKGLKQCTVEARIYRYGWDEVAAITTPARHKKASEL